MAMLAIVLTFDTMSVRSKIAAWLMMCLYVVILLHNAVPHFHIDHSAKEHDQAHHHSHEATDHEHPAPANEDGTWFKSFHSLQHGLAHFDLGRDHLNTYNKTQTEVTYPVAITGIIIVEDLLSQPAMGPKLAQRLRYISLFVPLVYSASDPLRGPPLA